MWRCPIFCEPRFYGTSRRRTYRMAKAKCDGMRGHFNWLLRNCMAGNYLTTWSEPRPLVTFASDFWFLTESYTLKFMCCYKNVWQTGKIGEFCTFEVIPTKYPTMSIDTVIYSDRWHPRRSHLCIRANCKVVVLGEIIWNRLSSFSLRRIKSSTIAVTSFIRTYQVDRKQV